MSYTVEQQQAYAAYLGQGYDQQTALQAALTNYPAPVQQEIVINPMQAPVAQAVQPGQVVATVQTGAINALLNIVNEVATEEDHGSTSQGMKARVGLAWLRILGYIEIGVHQPATANHSAKPIAYLLVEMHHPDHLRQDGSPGIERIRISKTHSGNSAFPKLFKHLRDCFPNENITHMGQLIGRSLVGEVFHNVDKQDKTWVNFDKEGAWSFKPTTGVNPDGSQYNIAIPELVGTPQMFLYDCPKTLANPAHMKAMWDTIFVAGTRKWKDAQGVETESSNNQWQERLVKSVKWATSETKAVLDQLGCDTHLGMEPAVQAPAAQQLGNALPVGGVAVQPQPAYQGAPMNTVAAVAAPVNVQAIAAQQANFMPATPVNFMPATPVVPPAQPLAVQPVAIAPVAVAPVAVAPIAVAPVVQQPMMAPVVEQQAALAFNQAVAPLAAPAPGAMPAMLDPAAFTAQYAQ